MVLATVVALVGVVPAAADGIPTWKSVTGFEAPIAVGMAANAGVDTVTYTIRARNNNQTKIGKVTISATIPNGATVIDSWAGVPGANKGVVEGNRISWFLSGINAGGGTPQYAFAVKFDGKSQLTTRARLTWVSGIGGYTDEFGAVTRDALSPVVDVVPPIAKPAAAAGVVPPEASVTGLEAALDLGLAWNASGNAVTYTIRAKNNTDGTYGGLRFFGLIPSGATVIDSWMGSPELHSNPGLVKANAGTIEWPLKTLGPGSTSPLMVYTVTWDGKATQTNRARLTWATPKSGGYPDATGNIIRDKMGSIVTVAPGQVAATALAATGIPKWASVTGFEPGLQVGIVANPAKDGSSVTFTMRAQNRAFTGAYTKLKIYAPIPAGTTLIDSWMGRVGSNPARIDGDGNVAFIVKSLGLRSSTPLLVWTVSWDGKTPLTTRAKVEYQGGAGGWRDEGGGLHKIALSDVVTVKP